MDIFTVVLILLLGVVIWRLSRKSRTRIMVDKLPGPPTWPIIGNLTDMLVPREELVSLLWRRNEAYGDILRTWLGPLPGVHISAPEYMETILSSNKETNKGTLYKFLYPWLGTGLLTSSGQKWFTHRKLITPTFHFKILDNFVPVFNENSDTLVRKLESKAKSGEEFDIYPFITLCALDIICETAMGTKIYAQEKAESTYVSSIYSLSTLTTQRAIRLWLHPDFVFYRTQMGKEYKHHLNVVHGFTENVIEERKRQRVARRKSSMKEEDDVGTKRRQAFLDLLLDASGDDDNSKLTDVELREEVDTFMFEGHDTTTAGMAWTIFLLGCHPDIQEKTYQELQEIFQDDPERSTTMKDLGGMKALERVIKESLRMYPSVPSISRVLSEDLKLGEYDIPSGTNIIMHFVLLHRNPKIFPNPDKFDPDRFLPENVQQRHPYAFVPFSAGARNCIGQKFALLEEKAILSAIIRNYKIESTMGPKDISLVSELVLRPGTSGIKVKLTKRV